MRNHVQPRTCCRPTGAAISPGGTENPSVSPLDGGRPLLARRTARWRVLAYVLRARRVLSPGGGGPAVPRRAGSRRSGAASRPGCPTGGAAGNRPAREYEQAHSCVRACVRERGRSGPTACPIMQATFTVTRECSDTARSTHRIHPIYDSSHRIFAVTPGRRVKYATASPAAASQ